MYLAINCKINSYLILRHFHNILSSCPSYGYEPPTTDTTRLIVGCLDPEHLYTILQKPKFTVTFDQTLVHKVHTNRSYLVRIIYLMICKDPLTFTGDMSQNPT